RTVRDLNVEPVRVLDVEALEVSGMIRHGIEPTLLELRLDLVRVPRVDAKREVADSRHSRGAWSAAATTTASTRGIARLCRSGRCGWRFVAVDEYGVADRVADLHHAALAVVVAHLPSHHGGVERNRLLVVDALVREVIEPHGFPTGRVEGCWCTSRVRGGAIVAAATSAALGETNRRNSDQR